MKIVLGSLNQTKFNAVKAVYHDAEIITEAVPSGVSAQPIGDVETKAGAIIRAQNAMKLHSNSIGIGLEGGVMFIQEELYLCNWGALVTPKGNIFTASGARIQLPQSFKKQLNNGIELSVIMDEFTRKNDIRNHEGAIGIFTNEKVLRHEMFTHVVLLLRGQMEYWE